MPNNIAEFVLRAKTEGGDDAKQFAVNLDDIDKVAARVAFTMVSLSAAQQAQSAAGKKQADSLNQTKTAADAAGKSMTVLQGATSLAQQAIGASFSVAGLYLLATSAAETVRSIGQIGDIMDVDTLRASKYAFAIEKTGRSFEVLRTAALYADAALQGARAGGPRQTKAFADLGIDVDSVKNVADLIDKSIAAYNSQITVEGKLLTQEQKITDLRVIFGRATKELLPLFEEGNAAIEKETGLTAEQVAKSEEFLRVMTELKNQLKLGIGLPIAEWIDGKTKLVALTGAAAIAIEVLAKVKNSAAAALALDAVSWIGKLTAGLAGAGAVAGSTALAWGALPIAIAAVATAIGADIYMLEKLHEESNAAAQAQKDLGDAIDKAQAKVGAPQKLLVQEIADLSQDQLRKGLSQWSIEKDKLQRDWDNLQAQMASHAFGVNLLPTDEELKKLSELRHGLQEADYYVDQFRTRLDRNRPSTPQSKELGTETFKAPDPAVVKAAWEAALTVEQSELAKREALRQASFKSQSISEITMLQDQLKDQLNYNGLEQRATEAELEGTIAARKKAMQDGKVIDQKAYDEALANQEKLSAKLIALQNDRDKLIANAKAKGAEVDIRDTEAIGKLSADVQIQLAEATGNKLIAAQIKLQQQIAEIRDRYAKLHPGEVGPSQIDAQLNELRQLKNVQLQFDDTLQTSSQTIAGYRDEQEKVKAAMQANVISTSDGRRAIADYDRQIQETVDKAVPKLLAFIQTLKTFAAAHPDLKIDTAAMEKSLLDLQAKSHAGTTHISSDLLQLHRQWTDLSSQLDKFVSSTLQSVSTTFASTITDMIFRTGNARQAWQQLGQAVVQMLVQMAGQYVAAKLAMLAVEMASGSKIIAMNTAKTASGAASGVANSGAEGSWVNMLIYLGVFAAVMAAVMAIAQGASGGFAEGGIVGGGGRSSKDNRLIFAADGEPVISNPAADHYGRDFFMALNSQAIPRDAIRRALEGRTFSVSAMPSSGPAFAGGGIVGGAGIELTEAFRNAIRAELKLEIHNHNLTAITDRDIAKIHQSEAGQKAMTTTLRRKRVAMKRDVKS